MNDKYERQLAATDRSIRETVTKMKALTENAAHSGRGLNEDEQAEMNTHMKAVEVLRERRTEVEAAIETRRMVDDIGNSVVLEPEAKSVARPNAPRSIGEAFVKSDNYLAQREKGFRGSWSTGSIEIEGKTLLDSSGVGHDDSGLVQPDVQPGILPTLFQPLRIANLLSSSPTTSSIVRYLQETVATSGAAGVAEGASKPESTLAFDATDAVVKKIATLLPVTDEMLEDVPALQGYINSRLSLFVRTEEERQLLNGSGGDEVDGILGAVTGPNTGVTSTVDMAQHADHIYQAMTNVRLAFLEPDAAVVHPQDWADIQLLKDSFGRYLGSGPFNNAVGPNIWGMSVVVTTAISAGTVLVGAFRDGAGIFRKGGLSVEASNSHSDFFGKNKTAIRCEERLALAIYRPEAFVTADVSGS